MPALRSVATTRSTTLVGALLLTTAFTVPAFAQIETVVVTAEKRVQDVQTVPVAISVFGSDKRDAVGIQSIQDMTNFTPGLQYSTSTDRISLRGVGRMTNVLSADASVANYDDGMYETFAVAAGRSSLDLDRVEVLRGPQGTLYGRNAIAGALNEVTRHPSYDETQIEGRFTYGAYDHYTTEARVSIPIGDNWAASVYGVWDKQTQGFAKNIVPGMPEEYGVLDDFYADGQIQAKFFGGKLDMWTKYQTAWWWGGAGNAGSQSAGWQNFDTPTYEFGTASTMLNTGYGCTALPGGRYATANTTVLAGSVVTPLPAATACDNPGFGNPWKIAHLVAYDVHLPQYESVDTQWTWHANNFDIKYIGGGTYYHYILTGGGDSQGSADARAPISSYAVGPAPGVGITVGTGLDNFRYQEMNGFISNELNFISTGQGSLQWQAGVYQFQQHYRQPVSANNAVGQPQYATPTWGCGVFYDTATGVCAPNPSALDPSSSNPLALPNWFDNRPAVHATSEAVYGQLDWKATDELKFTGGLRYSADRKYGTESVRLLCYHTPACEVDYLTTETPEFAGAFPAFFNASRSQDLTQTGSVVSTGTNPGLPRGVLGVTTYDANGFANRAYHASWGALTGTAGVEWTPDDSTLVYGKYSRGYKSGGFNIGIFTVLSFQPYTAAEHVDSFEIGAKKTFGDWLTADVAVFHYAYTNLQIPVSIVQSAGGLAQAQTTFFNVPGAISEGAELETIISPLADLNILFNYSYLDAHVSRGQLADPADPNATAPGATPALTDAQCMAAYGTTYFPTFSAPFAAPFTSVNVNAPCTRDIYTAGTAPSLAAPLGDVTGVNGVGWNKPQNLHGNVLPNAPRNKVALNVMYTFHLEDWGTITPSVSYVWRDAQYGTLFTRSYNRAPSWDQWDMRARWISSDDHWEAIFFGKNVFNKIGYDAGAVGTRLAGSVDTACTGPLPSPGQTDANAGIRGIPICNFIQGVNNPTGYGAVRGEDATGHVTTYSPTPPATWGIELHYKL